jgi:hypothetical protein
MWSETITRHSTHAEAILERAGTRWHSKTRAEAVGDFELGCSLGSANGCSDVPKMKAAMNR